MNGAGVIGFFRAREGHGMAAAAWCFLLSLAEPAAEADGVEEAAVAKGPRVAAAELGHAALGELGAAGLRGDHSHFDSGRRNGAFGRSGGLFRLLVGGEQREDHQNIQLQVRTRVHFNKEEK